MATERCFTSFAVCTITSWRMQRYALDSRTILYNFLRIIPHWWRQTSLSKSAFKSNYWVYSGFLLLLKCSQVPTYSFLMFLCVALRYYCKIGLHGAPRHHQMSAPSLSNVNIVSTDRSRNKTFADRIRSTCVIEKW